MCSQSLSLPYSISFNYRTCHSIISFNTTYEAKPLPKPCPISKIIEKVSISKWKPVRMVLLCWQWGRKWDSCFGMIRAEKCVAAPVPTVLIPAHFIFFHQPIEILKVESQRPPPPPHYPYLSHMLMMCIYIYICHSPCTYEMEGINLV